MRARGIPCLEHTRAQDFDPEFDPWFDLSHHDAYTLRELKTLCLLCPIRQRCLDAADDYESRTGYAWGLWGGLTPTERRTRRTAMHQPAEVKA